MGRKRPGKHQRRAHAKRLEFTARIGVANYNPAHPGYETVRDEPLAGPREPRLERTFTRESEYLDIPLDFSPLSSPRRESRPLSPANLHLPPANRSPSPAKPPFFRGLITPPQGRRPPLRVIRPRRQPGTRQTIPETPRSRRTPPPPSSRSPRDLLRRYRSRSVLTGTVKRLLTRDPRFDLFPETPPDRPVRTVVRMHEERDFMISLYMDSLPVDPADFASPGCRHSPRRS